MQNILPARPKPDAEFARKALMDQAEAMSTDNWVFQPEYLKALNNPMIIKGVGASPPDEWE